jgi:AcrR family transcriptional regulator
MARSPKVALKPPPKRQSFPRTPSREKGVQRYAVLLDALDALLAAHNPDDIGLYQIADHAGVPPGSVYHFFPTKEAAFLGLAQRYLNDLADLRRRPVPPSALTRWQDLFAWDLRLAVDYYNAHSPAMKLLLGGYGGLEIRQAHAAHSAQVTASAYRRLNAAFQMPFLRAEEHKFNLNKEVVDAVWSVSYLNHGCITDDYAQEALKACIAHGRLFLPEEVEPREDLAMALVGGQPIVLEWEEMHA